ncbi:MAG: sigma-54-dependent Fis family transcriptional regulator [Candidatus Aminicenantes bacterium]|nr:sigma-54-dependent Fis family transcriptional regulator [Candidatus Aminicenantes bacterium]
MKKKSGRVLIVDDDADVLQAAALYLKQHVEAVCTERDPTRIPQRLGSEAFDVILLDMNFARDVSSGREGFFWLDKILAIDPQAVVVLITAYGDVDLAVRAIKEGASEFVLKPWQNEKLLATVTAALKLRSSRSEAESLRRRQQQLSADLDFPFHDFIGSSPAMQQVFQTIAKVGATDANVLIIGENGTGKELVARALHRSSARAGEIFLAVDMGGISETLFESELFGHVKGSFTDARSDRVGRIELASNGTLFLDEVGNLPLSLQAKLLRVLETRQVTRLGSNVPVNVDIRLVCATNMPVADLVNRKQFRQDLLYRINTVEIHLPPLRERDDDLKELAEHFVGQFCRKYRKAEKTIGEAALKKLSGYHWPGNVRELKHSLERAVILSETPVLQPGDFLFSQAPEAAEELVFRDLNLEQAEEILIRRAMGKYQGNVSQAAKELGLTRAALYRRLEKYGL